jgi:hypothetical protein
MSLRRHLTGRTATIVVVVVAILLGFLSQFQIIGQVVVGLYGVVAVLNRIPHRTTIVLALLALGVVPVAIVAGRVMVATNFAVYAFLLFVTASIIIARELTQESKVILAQRRLPRE